MLSVFNVCSIRACTRVYALIGADRRVYAPIGAQCECNSLPADIRLCENILTFKRHLKTHLFKLT